MKLPPTVKRAMERLEHDLGTLDFDISSGRELLDELRRLERQPEPYEEAIRRATHGDEKLYRAWRDGEWGPVHPIVEAFEKATRRR